MFGPVTTSIFVSLSSKTSFAINELFVDSLTTGCQPPLISIPSFSTISGLLSPSTFALSERVERTSIDEITSIVSLIFCE